MKKLKGNYNYGKKHLRKDKKTDLLEILEVLQSQVKPTNIILVNVSKYDKLAVYFC